MSDSIHGDTLAKDLNEIVVGALPELSVEQYKKLMEPLVIYVVRRDHLVHDAGIETGKQIANGDLEPEEEQ